MLVPTIKGIPVLLPPHEDTPDFGDPGIHYHIDYRFCSDPPVQNRVLFSTEEPTWEEREQVREDYELVYSGIMVLLLLTVKYREEKLNRCGRCPHKGLPVTNGQCPGHGLSFRQGKVDSQLFIQLVGIEESRRLLTLETMREWIKAKRGFIRFDFKSGESSGKSFSGVEIVNRDGRSLAKIPFKQEHCGTITSEGGVVYVTITDSEQP